MRPRIVMAAVAVLLVLTACGDDGESSETAQDNTGSEAGAQTASEGGGSDAGGSAADGEAIPVGFVNLEGGPISLPEIRVGFEEGINHVNTDLDGVGGRPIEIVESCATDLTPESSVNCANTMIEAGVAVVFQGVDVAADAGLPLYQEAGVPQIAVFGVSPGLNAAEGDVFTYVWATEEGFAGAMKAQQELGANRVVLALTDTAASRSYGDTLVPQLAEELGMDVEMVYYPADVDWATFVQTILASDPEGISFLAPTDQDCLGMVPAMQAAGWDGPLHAGSCNLMLDILPPDQLAGVTTHAEYTWPTMVTEETPQEVRDELATYEEYVGAANQEYVGGFSTLGFALAVTGAEMLGAVDGEYTPQSVREALPTASGTVHFSEIPFNCDGSAWPGTSSCRSDMIFTEITEDATRTEYPWSPVDVSELKPDAAG